MCTKFVDAISTSYCIRTTSIGKTSPSDLIEQNRLFLVMVMVNTKYLMKAIMTHSMHCLFYKVPKDISRLFFCIWTDTFSYTKMDTDCGYLRSKENKTLSSFSPHAHLHSSSTLSWMWNSVSSTSLWPRITLRIHAWITFMIRKSFKTWMICNTFKA